LKKYSAHESFCREIGKANHGLPAMMWNKKFEGDDNFTIVSVETEFNQLSDLEAIIKMCTAKVLPQPWKTSTNCSVIHENRKP
jgi:hypothetical protein